MTAADGVRKRWRALGCLGALVGLAAPQAVAQDTAILSGKDIHHPVLARNGMVASQEATATRVGVRILKQGGNAVDAAVAVGFTLAVTLDYREMAPAAASRTRTVRRRPGRAGNRTTTS